MYDAIIVGARCAGSPTAMLLARKGYRVLLVDKASFPSDTPKGHYIQPIGVAKLADWGLLNRLTATGSPPVLGGTFDLGPFALHGSPRWPNGEVAVAYAPRRSTLDAILVQGSVEAGAELRERFAVEGLLFDDNGRVLGIRGRAGGGAAVEERARIVIGADGTHSRVARLVGASSYEVHPPLTGAYWSYWSGLDLDGIEVHPREGKLAVAFPTDGGLVGVGAQWPHGEFHRVRADVEGSFFAVLDEAAPELAEQVRVGRREEPFVGRFDLLNLLRTPYGPGWALVGDAGYVKDPILGQGIGDAFRDAELLAEALDEGWSGRAPLELALAAYARCRDEQVMPTYHLNTELAQLQAPPPETVELFEALRDNQAETDRFFGAIGGTVSVAEFFAPENVERIVGARPLAAAA